MKEYFFSKNFHSKISSDCLKYAFLVLIFIASLLFSTRHVESKVLVSEPYLDGFPEKKEFVGDHFIHRNEITGNFHVFFLPLIRNGDPPPSGFNKHAPANGTTYASLSPVLSWNTSANATKYEYCYDTTNDGSCNNWISTGTNNYVGLWALQPATTYFWQVRAWNGTYGPTYANGSPTAYWSFKTVIMVPGTFNKYAPANGSTGASLIPVLSWNTSANATKYEYCYDTTNDSSCSNWISTGTNNWAGLSGLQPATTYYWQVRAWNGIYGPTYANGSESSYWSFTTVIMVPSPFNKNAPANGSTGATLSPILSWNISANANKYEYCYDTTNDGSCSNWISTGTNTYVGLSGLQPGTTYYWQVRSWNGIYGPTYANGNITSLWSFETLGPGVHILESCSMYATNNTYIHLVCEVYNNTSSNIENVKLYIDIYNSLGELIDTDYAYTLLDIIHIQEKACIDLPFARPADPNFYIDLGDLSYRDTAGSRPNLSLSNDSGNAGGSLYTVLGILTNNGLVPVYSVKAVDSLYLRSGEIIGCDYSYINKDPHDLFPGQSSSFEITTSLPDPDSITKYSIQYDAEFSGEATEPVVIGNYHVISNSKTYHLTDLLLLTVEVENSDSGRLLGE